MAMILSSVKVYFSKIGVSSNNPKRTELYVPAVKITFCVLIKELTNLKFFQSMPHSRATLYLIYIGQPSSSDV